MVAVTFGDLKSRILRETNKTSSAYLTDIGDAIVTAIRYWDNKPTFFNETSTTLTLVEGDNSVSLPSDFRRAVRLQLLYNNYYYGQGDGFDLVTLPELRDNWRDPTLEGRPVQAAISGDTIYFNCIADTDYTLRIDYNYGDTTYPSADGDTSVWFDAGADVIRYEATSTFYADRLHAYERSAACKAQAEKAYSSVLTRSNSQQSEYRLCLT